MATYKVAQDVEAEDKLLGPFSFRQFIYIVIAAMAGIIAWGLAQLFMPLFIIPMPIVLFFLVLALPLRKDQPMEIYLAAIVSFYLKPRKRLWQPDGVEALIEVTATHEAEKDLTKGISSDEATRRLEYLASIADTKGWSVRNIAEPVGTSMNSDVYHEAQSYQDMFDTSGTVAQSFDSMIDQADANRRQSIIDSMKQPAATSPQIITTETSFFAEPSQQPTTTTFDPQQFSIPTTSSQSAQSTAPQFDPYPTNMRQHVLHPVSQTPAPSAPVPQPVTYTAPEPYTPQAAPQSVGQSTTIQEASPVPAPIPEPVHTPKTTSDTPISPDIISLANNHDLSIETIAREAHRIEAKHKDDDSQEVIISLR